MYACSISGILNRIYPAPEHGYGTVQVSSELVHDLGVKDMSLYKLKASVIT